MGSGSDWIGAGHELVQQGTILGRMAQGADAVECWIERLDPCVGEQAEGRFKSNQAAER